jgi:tellurite resistance protein TerC
MWLSFYFCKNKPNMSLNPWLLTIFIVVIISMLLIDLGLVNKKAHQITNKEALCWTLIWVGLSMGFSALIWLQMGFVKFAEYQSAYWIEEALSIDNMFVFILVFKFFKLEGKLQHRVLFWGIIGALIFRGIFIFSGIGLIKLTYLPPFEIFGYPFNLDQEMHSVAGQFYRPNVILTLFGAFLVYTGLKSLSGSANEEQKDFNKSMGARMLRKIFPVTNDYYNDQFFIRKGNKRFATQLFLVLIVIETTDLIFAIDSIPAIFAIAPDDPMILYTSNIFAVLGLRSMYFLLANSIHLFDKLKYGLAFVLSFIGLKMLIAPFYHVSASVSLAIVIGALSLSIFASLLSRDKA